MRATASPVSVPSAEGVSPSAPKGFTVTGSIAAYDASEREGKVIPLARRMQVHISHPRSFNDAQEIGDRVKAGSVVIVVLHDADSHLASRIRDFAFGLVAGCKGTASQGGAGILVLAPSGVEMTGTEELAATG